MLLTLIYLIHLIINAIQFVRLIIPPQLLLLRIRDPTFLRRPPPLRLSLPPFRCLPLSLFPLFQPRLPRDPLPSIELCRQAARSDLCERRSHFQRIQSPCPAHALGNSPSLMPSSCTITQKDVQCH